MRAGGSGSPPALLHRSGRSKGKSAPPTSSTAAATQRIVPDTPPNASSKTSSNHLGSHNGCDSLDERLASPGHRPNRKMITFRRTFEVRHGSPNSGAVGDRVHALVLRCSFAASVVTRPHGDPRAQRSASGVDGRPVWRGREAGPSGSKEDPGNRTTGDPANLGNPCAEKESRIRRGNTKGGSGGELVRAALAEPRKSGRSSVANPNRLALPLSPILSQNATVELPPQGGSESNSGAVGG